MPQQKGSAPNWVIKTTKPAPENGARAGTEVRSGKAKGSGLGLFVGGQDIEPGAFIALQRGAWISNEDGSRAYAGDSAYAINTGEFTLVPPVTAPLQTIGDMADPYPAARINEPSEGERGNAFARQWFRCAEVLGGAPASQRIECLAIHAGDEGIRAGQEIKWHYGKDYKAKRRNKSGRRYKVGKPCGAVLKRACETPASYYASVNLRVPEDAYHLE